MTANIPRIGASQTKQPQADIRKGKGRRFGTATPHAVQLVGENISSLAPKRALQDLKDWVNSQR